VLARSSPHVLVVDDEASIRAFLSRWLASWGCRVEVAADAKEALAHMAKEPAQVILCDVMMPGRDGLSLLEEVRRRWPLTAVIMATAVQELETVVRSRKGGAVAFVTKPFGRVPLLQALQRACVVLPNR